MTKIQLLATLLALFIFAMLGACSNEDYPEPDVFKVTPDLRTRINTGIKMASRTENGKPKRLTSPSWRRKPSPEWTSEPAHSAPAAWCTRRGPAYGNAARWSNQTSQTEEPER